MKTLHIRSKSFSCFFFFNTTYELLFFFILNRKFAPEALLGLSVELQHITPQSPRKLTLLQSSVVFGLKFPTVSWHWWVV